MRRRAKPDLEALQAHSDLKDEDPEVKIALTELMAVVGMATKRGEAWRGKLVLAVSDNDNTVIWLEGRGPKNRVARRLIRLLRLLELASVFFGHTWGSTYTSTLDFE